MFSQNASIQARVMSNVHAWCQSPLTFLVMKVSSKLLLLRLDDRSDGLRLARVNSSCCSPQNATSQQFSKFPNLAHLDTLRLSSQMR